MCILNSKNFQIKLSEIFISVNVNYEYKQKLTIFLKPCACVFSIEFTNMINIIFNHNSYNYHA